MSDETTARLAMPLLQPGQAQKETTHNEALALIDLAAQAVVTAVGIATPPAAPAIGDCWIVATGATGAWAGKAQAIAGWTAGGWRFVAPRAGMSAWSLADHGLARFDGTAWTLAAPVAAIADPSGGTTTDARARTAIQAILAALRQHGIVAAI